MLLLEISQLEMRLASADVMAMMIDVFVQRGYLNSRSLVGDARLDYGEPWNYKYASRKILEMLGKGLPEIERLFKERDTSSD